MAYYLPHNPQSCTEHPAYDPASAPSLTDLKVFWGPEICRLEYLIHLLETGRIKDERRPAAGTPTARSA